MKARRGYIALLSADTLSAAGSQVSFLAIPWLVWTTTASPTKMGFTVAAEMLPYVLTGVFAAPLADRFGIRRTVIVANAGSAVAMAAISAFGSVGFAILLLLVAVAGGLRGIGDRSKNVLVRPIAQAARIPVVRMTALYEGFTRGATLVGAPLGGVLIYWLGARGAIRIDAMSFALCAVLVALWVKMPASEPTAAGVAVPEKYLAALKGGATFLLGNRLLLALVAMTLASNLFNQAATGVYVPLWVGQVLKSPAALGLVSGSFAAGAVLGSIGFAILASKVPRYATFVVGFLVGGAPRLLILGFSHNLALVLTVTFLAGVAMTSVNPIIGALMYERVPAHFQTRVFSLAAAVSFIGIPLGGLLAGWTVDGLGLDHAIILSGLMLLGIGVVPLLLRSSFTGIDTPTAGGGHNRTTRSPSGAAAARR